jgi:hypothetical protein
MAEEYQPQPGERLLGALLTGNIDGDALGKAIFFALPALPHETGGLPLPIPRWLIGDRAAPASSPVPEQVIPAAMTAHLQPDGSYKIDGEVERFDYLTPTPPRPRTIPSITNLQARPVNISIKHL